MTSRTTAVVGAAVILLVGIAPALAAQERGVDFVVEPGAESQAENGYFLIHADPGDEIEQSVVLRNDTKKDLRLRLAAVDATTGTYGGASYALPNQQARLTGSWISLDDRAVALAAGEGATVGFTVTVPDDALSGQHLAGLAVWSPRKNGGDGVSSGGASIRVQTRRIVAVQVDLPGPAQPHLTISGVEPIVRPDGVYLAVDITNDGRGLTTGKGNIEVVEGSFKQDFAIDTFIPQTELAYPIKWRKAAPEGDYNASVKIRYDGRVATWEGSFRVGPEVEEGLTDRGIDSPNGFPLVMLLIAAGVLLLVAALWWRRKKHGGRPQKGREPEQRGEVVEEQESVHANSP